jgi:isochorismate hydrolase
MAIPSFYANDNRRKWRSAFSAVLGHCLRGDAQGRGFVARPVPEAAASVLLKPKHSVFYATPLDTPAFLPKSEDGSISRTHHKRILTSACEIYLRDLKLHVPSDCVAAWDEREHGNALEVMRKSFQADTTPTKRLDVPRASQG